MASAAFARTAAAMGLVVLAACSRGVGQASAPADQKPLFRIDEGRRGALTLDELQVHTEGNVALTPERRACYLAKIGELAAAAGDPETADVVALGYVTDGEGWRRLKRDGRRLILAQAIVSRAISYCPQSTKAGG